MFNGGGLFPCALPGSWAVARRAPVPDVFHSQLLSESSDLGLGVSQLHGQVLLDPRVLLLLLRPPRMEARGLGAVGAVGARQGADHRLPVLHQVRDRLEEKTG